MKRFMQALLMLAIILTVCACTDKDNKKEKKPSSANKSTVTSASADEDGMSDDEAFSIAEGIVAKMSLDEKIGQMFMVHLSQLSDERSYDGSQYVLTKRMRKMIERYHIGGIYLTVNNINTKRQTKKLCDQIRDTASGSSIFLAVCEEGGDTHSLNAGNSSLNVKPYMSAKELGESTEENKVRTTGQRMGKNLSSMGVNVNLAPVADVDFGKYYEYSKRCFGKDEDKVSESVEQMIGGMHDSNVATVTKYFPGYSDLYDSSEEQMVECDKSLMDLRSKNFPSYEAAISAGTDCIMMNNVSYKRIYDMKIPAFCSHDIVTKLLRKELEYDGVVMTAPLDDDSIRNNYNTEFTSVQPIKAGCDILFLPNNFEMSYNYIKEAVEKGEISKKRINASVIRIIESKIIRGMINIEETND